MPKPAPKDKSSTTDVPARLKAAQKIAREAMEDETQAVEKRVTDVKILPMP